MKLLDANGKDTQDLELGIVEVGSSKEYEYVLFNDTEAEAVDIEVSINNKEIKIVESPKKMPPMSKSKLKIKWSPTLEVKKASKTKIQIDVTELYHL